MERLINALIKVAESTDSLAQTLCKAIRQAQTPTNHFDVEIAKNTAYYTEQAVQCIVGAAAVCIILALIGRSVRYILDYRRQTARFKAEAMTEGRVKQLVEDALADDRRRRAETERKYAAKEAALLEAIEQLKNLGERGAGFSGELKVGEYTVSLMPKPTTDDPK